MWRYDIVFGILLTLPIIDFKFALAAPVLVQEKRHAYVDAVHSPKDVMTVLEKRGDDILKLVEDYLDKLPDAHASSTMPSTANPDPLIGPPSLSPTDSSMAGGSGDIRKMVEDHSNIKLSDPHASSSSAPPGPDHGSEPKVDVPVPTRNLALSTANPDPLMGPPSLSPTASPMAEGDDFHRFLELVNQAAKLFETPQRTITSSDAHASSSAAPLWANHVSMTDMQAPAPNLAVSTANPGPLMESSPTSSTGSSMAVGNDHSDGLSNLVGFSKTSQKPVESSGAHASSSPAPLSWPNYVPAPASNLASPTVNLAPPMEPPSVL